MVNPECCVVVKRVGRLPRSGILNYAREKLLAQNTKDIIQQAVVNTWGHNLPIPAQVIKKKY
jgi:hypothetical protein